MGSEGNKSFRGWVAWTIGGVWILTGLVVLITTRIHPTTVADISLNVKKISFLTNTSHVFGSNNEEQLLVSGVSVLRIQFEHTQTIKVDGHPTQVNTLEIQGDASASCSFYQIRSNGFELNAPSIVTLDKLNSADPRSFGLQVHGMISGNFSSRPAQLGLTPGFECKEVNTGEKQNVDVEGTLSNQGGDSIFIATSFDPRFDIVTTPHSEVGDTQIPIFEELRFSEIDPSSGEEKSVLLKPNPEILFEKLNKKVTVKDADLLTVLPRDNFYLRRFAIENGIQLNLHGSVQEIRVGAGPSAMETVMPSAFDHLDNEKRIFGGIPAMVVLILGVLEQMGALKKSEKA